MIFNYRNPRSAFYPLRDEMDRLWSGLLGTAADGVEAWVSRNQPPVNVWEQETALVVELEVPGVRKDQVDISVTGDELSIRVNRPESEEKDVTYHRRERPVGTFSRVVRLPVGIDADHVEAEIRDGVLTITLPKAESAKPRKIHVAG
jgi:HSP20 family protein